MDVRVISGFAIAALVGASMVIRTARLCSRHCVLYPHLGFLLFLAAVWWAMPAAKVLWIDHLAPPLDAIQHEDHGHGTASLLGQFRFAEALETFEPGNPAYQFLLGVFYACTDAPEYAVYMFNSWLAFCGLLLILEVVACHANVPRLSALVPIVVVGMPSPLFWCTSNLKEGPMVWAGSCLLAWAFLPGFQGIGCLLRTAIAAFVAIVLRPHMGAVWIAAIAITMMVRKRHFALGIVSAAVAVSAIIAWSMVAEKQVNAIMEDGIGSAVGEFYEQRSSLGGSAISYANGAPIPVVSGFVLLLLRPLPHETQGILELLAGAEIWLLTSLMAWGLLRQANKRDFLLEPPFLAALIAICGFAVLFTAMYNMGLMVRQRVQTMPALLILAAFPYVRNVLATATKPALRFRLRFDAGGAAPMPGVLNGCRRLSSAAVAAGRPSSNGVRQCRA